MIDPSRSVFKVGNFRLISIPFLRYRTDKFAEFCGTASTEVNWCSVIFFNDSECSFDNITDVNPVSALTTWTPHREVTFRDPSDNRREWIVKGLIFSIT